MAGLMQESGAAVDGRRSELLPDGVADRIGLSLFLPVFVFEEVLLHLAAPVKAADADTGQSNAGTLRWTGFVTLV